MSSLRTPAPPRRRRLAAALAASLAVVLTLGLVVSAVPAAAEPLRPDPTLGASDVGRWSVRVAGGGRYVVSWTSPTRFPISADRPTISGDETASVRPPTVSADGRTVRAVVTAPRAPKPTQLNVWLSGNQLDAGASTLRARSQIVPPAIDPRPVRRLTTDPGTPGPYAVTSSDYTRAGVKVAGMAQPIEMVGHVVEPVAGAATGPRPLVLFLHGRHSYCYGGDDDGGFDWPCRGTAKEIPSQLGYDYAQRLLASQGYTTVSIRVNGINAQDYALDDGGASARATIVAKHLDYWTTIAASHQVDLSRVVLVGHSRGGEGVDRASIRIPLTAPYRIVGQVLIAPTDFATQTAPYVPTVTMLPYCDGDVSDLQGQRFTDVGRDLTTDDRSLKSSVLVMGANHNFFNTEWTPGLSAAPSDDDWFGDPQDACGTKTAARLTAAKQQAVGKAYIAAAVAQFTAGSNDPQPYLPLFDGTRATVDSIGSAVVLSHAIGGGRDVRRPSVDTGLTLPSGARSAFCTGSTSYEFRVGLCGSELADLTAPHWPSREEPVPARKFWDVSWSSRGQSAGLQLNRTLDLRQRTLDLRAIVDPRLGDVAVRVRLTDTAGRTATLTPVGGATVRRLLTAPSVTKLWAQTIQVDPRAVSTLDLSRVTAVEILGDSPDGRLWIADLAAAPDRLPTLVAKRTPALSIGSLRVKEGNQPGITVAEVPFTLSAPMTVPGRFQVVTVGAVGAVQTFTVDLAAGQTSGTIPVGYQGDSLDSPDELTTVVEAWGTRNVMTDQYIGSLTVLDDDPTPKVTITRVRSPIKEGSSAQWRATFAQPVGFDAVVIGTVVLGPGQDLTGADVPKAWLDQYTRGEGTNATLARLGVEIYGVVPTGSRTTTLSIPVRKDGKTEGKEAVTLKIEALRTVSTSTIEVAASS